jgi:AcrR family transcriptional regulator
MTEVDSSEPAANADDGADTPAWRRRAVSRSLNAARSRAEQRVQRFLDAAFELIDEKGTTEFTIQEVIDQSKQSLRGFYQYFDGKDELLLALFEETVREAIDDLGSVVESTTGPLERLRAYTIRLHEWCDPSDKPRKRGSHNRRPIMEFSVQLAVDHPVQVKAAMAPLSRTMVELVDAAAKAGAIDVADTRRAALLIEQTVMYSWFGNRLAANSGMRVTAEDTWDFCLHGLGAGPGR